VTESASASALPRAIPTLDERQRKSKIFAAAYELSKQTEDKLADALDALQRAENNLVLRDQQIEFLKAEIRRVNLLADVHAQERTSLESAFRVLRDTVCAVALREKIDETGVTEDEKK
jgi:hypothetical protein